MLPEQRRSCYPPLRIMVNSSRLSGAGYKRSYIDHARQSLRGARAIVRPRLTGLLAGTAILPGLWLYQELSGQEADNSAQPDASALATESQLDLPSASLPAPSFGLLTVSPVIATGQDGRQRSAQDRRPVKAPDPRPSSTTLAKSIPIPGEAASPSGTTFFAATVPPQIPATDVGSGHLASMAHAPAAASRHVSGPAASTLGDVHDTADVLTEVARAEQLPIIGAEQERVTQPVPSLSLAAANSDTNHSGPLPAPAVRSQQIVQLAAAPADESRAVQTASPGTASPPDPASPTDSLSIQATAQIIAASDWTAEFSPVLAASTLTDTSQPAAPAVAAEVSPVPPLALRPAALAITERATNSATASSAATIPAVQLIAAPAPATFRQTAAPTSAQEHAGQPTPVPGFRAPLVEPTSAKVLVIGPEPISGLQIPSPLFGHDANLVPAAFVAGTAAANESAPGQASTLAQAIAYSYANSPQLLAERAANRSADFGLPAARAGYGPRLDASATYAFTRDRFEDFPGYWTGMQGWTNTASLVLSQPLFTFGRNRAAEGGALASVEYRRAALELAQNQLMLDVVSAYVGVLREAGAVTIARENVALLERELTDSNARFKVREITSSDVQQVETRLQLGRTLLLDSQARLGETQARFHRAVGMPPGELAPPPPIPLPVSSLAEAYALGDANSPLIKAAQARERISRAQVEAARAAEMPRVDLSGRADYGTLTDYSSALRTSRLRGQVTLSVPLFDSGGRSAELAQSKEANLADQRLTEAAARDNRVAVAAGWNNLLAAHASVENYRQAVESAKNAYEGALLQERAGMRTTLDVLDLARDLLNVRNSYNTSLAAEYVARASLLVAMGRLDPQAMAPGLTLYDPETHFRKVSNNADLPLLTGALRSLDGVVLHDLVTARPNVDPAAMTGTGETVTGQ